MIYKLPWQKKYKSGLYTNDSTSSLRTARSHATASFHVAIKGGRHTTTVKKKPQCIYCKSEHSPITCSEVTDHQKRLEIVRKANLCFNCLGNHKVTQCNSKFRCRHCRHKHHTSPMIVTHPNLVHKELIHKCNNQHKKLHSK